MYLNIVGGDVSAVPHLVAGLDEGGHADSRIAAPNLGDGGLDPPLVGVEVQPPEVGVHGAGAQAASISTATAGRERGHGTSNRQASGVWTHESFNFL